MTTESAVGAFVPGTEGRVRATGSGPLNGLTFAVKDLIDIAGYITGGGNPDWAADQAPAVRSAPVVDILLNAGSTFVGKTITDELAFSLEGANVHYGTPLNPRCPDRLPGGSSSGSAAAVAAGLSDFALGTDTGGSVRVPASFCGLYGFRPTHGRVPTSGVVPFAPSYDTVGWFARSAKLLARVGHTLLAAQENEIEPVGTRTTEPTGTMRDANGPHHDNPLPLVIADDAFELVDSACAAPLRAAAGALGAQETVQVFEGKSEKWLHAYQILQGFEIWRSLGNWVSKRRPRFGAEIQSRFTGASDIRQTEVASWLPFRHEIRSQLTELLAHRSWLVLPTTPSLPLHKAASAAERTEFYRVALTLNAIAGHGGLPQLTLPLCELDGCPLGLSIVGPPGSDEALLHWARQSLHRPFLVEG
ncbi:MAG: amidase [Gammaproteobacteria bacterium]